MKRRLTLMIPLLLLVCHGASAQLSWNVKAGMNLSNWSNPLDTRALTGYRLGAGLQYDLTPRWALQPSLFFSAKGAQVLLGSEAGGSYTSYRELYLELPLHVQWLFPLGGQHTLLLAAGPYVALGVGGSIEGKVQGRRIEPHATFGRNGLSRFDYGLGVGAGYRFMHLLLGVEYQFGLRRLGRDNLQNRVLNDPRNANLSIWVGYAF